MPSTSIATPYAQSLYQTATQKDILPQVYKDICLVTTLYNTHPELDLFLKNPTLKTTQKQRLLEHTLKLHIHTQTLAFLYLIIKKKRHKIFHHILHTFIDLCKKKKKIQIAHITTAQKLSPILKAQITTLICKITHSNTIELVEHVKPSVLGGYILQIEDKQIDTSLRTKLEQLKYLWTKKESIKTSSHT